MTTSKTQDLTGAALDWAVAEAAGIEVEIRAESPYKVHDSGGVWLHPTARRPYMPSSEWRDGGPILHGMVWSGFELTPSIIGFRCSNHTDEGLPRQNWDCPIVEEVGADPLKAVCRAKVSEELGDEVDVPEELV